MRIATFQVDNYKSFSSSGATLYAPHGMFMHCPKILWSEYQGKTPQTKAPSPPREILCKILDMDF